MINFFAAAQCNVPGVSDSIVYSSHLPQTCANSTSLNKVFLIVFAILGAMALFFMVLAGARYALSKGEPENIQKAKNELKYSAIGLIIVSLAAAIVNFVINRLK